VGSGESGQVGVGTSLIGVPGGVRDGIRPVGVGVVEPVSVLVGPRVIVGVVVRVGVAVGPPVGVMGGLSMGGIALGGRSNQSVGVGKGESGGVGKGESGGVGSGESGGMGSGEFGGVGASELNSAALNAVAGCLPAGTAAGIDRSVSRTAPKITTGTAFVAAGLAVHVGVTRFSRGELLSGA
jgi:hypothetical protein